MFGMNNYLMNKINQIKSLCYCLCCDWRW